MTKPSDFILNSDYLSIAQYDRTEFTLAVPQYDVPQDSHVTYSANFTIPTKNGVITRVMLKLDDRKYYVGSNMTLYPATYQYEDVRVHLESQNTFKVEYWAENLSSSVMHTSAHTITVKVCSFRPPNVF